MFMLPFSSKMDIETDYRWMYSIDPALFHRIVEGSKNSLYSHSHSKKEIEISELGWWSHTFLNHEGCFYMFNKLARNPAPAPRTGLGWILHIVFRSHRNNRRYF